MESRYTKENPLRVFEAFAGYGSQALALERLKQNFPDFDYRCVGFSEIEDAAIKAYNLLHPNVPNFGDITKIDWEQVPDFDLFTYSSPCFIAGTLVLTDSGLKRIENITASDLVLSHDNQYHHIKAIGHKPAECIIKVKGMGTDGIYCTPNHPFYVREMYRYGHKSIRAFREPEWKQAVGLTNKDYLGIAINQENKLPEWNGTTLHYGGHDCHSNELSAMLDNKDFWYVIGRYIGDGWTRNDELHKQLVICYSDRNGNGFIEKVRGLGFNPTVTNERTTYRCIINSKELMQFVDRFGHYAHGKHIDGETFNLPIELLMALLDGCLDSDGCFIEKTREYKITTVSKELAYGLQQIVAKVYHAPTRIYKSVRPKTTVIEGREVNQRDSYEIVWHTDIRKQDHAFYENGYVWYPCNGIELTDLHEYVYNMEVEDSHSYTANGAIVHNCQDFSQAGLQKGGTEGTGTRSSLLWECRRAIVAKKPKFLLLENVAALVSAKFLPLFNKWREELASYGYNSFAQVLNAKNFGVPQNRERIFLVSIRDDGEDPQFYFPEPFKLQTCLADVLEEDVEQKYFLKDEMVAKFLKANEKDPMVYVPTDHFLSDEEIEKAINEYDFESDGLAHERECARSRRRVTKMLYLRTDNPFDGVENSKPDIFLVSFNDGEDREICIDLWYVPLAQIYPAFCDIMRPYTKAVADAWDLYVTEASAKGLSPYTLNQLIGYEEHD